MSVNQLQVGSTYAIETMNFHVGVLNKTTVGTLDVVYSLATAGTLNVKGYVAPWAGSIVGVSGNLSDTPAAGTLTLYPIINGVRANLSAGSTRGGVIKQTLYAKQDARVDRFSEGDTLGIVYETNSGLDPDDELDGVFQLHVLYEEIRY